MIDFSAYDDLKVTGSEPPLRHGDIWYDPSRKTLKRWDSETRKWEYISPERDCCKITP